MKAPTKPVPMPVPMPVAYGDNSGQCYIRWPHICKQHIGQVQCTCKRK